MQYLFLDTGVSRLEFKTGFDQRNMCPQKGQEIAILINLCAGTALQTACCPTAAAYATVVSNRLYTHQIAIPYIRIAQNYRFSPIAKP